MIIKITKRTRDNIERFADSRTSRDAHLYKKRGAFKRDDILIGALGEMAAFKYLCLMGARVTHPDFTLYDVKDKSFNADLLDVNNNILYHIKAQSRESEEKYGCSYMFQKTDKLITQPKDNEKVICTVVALQNNEVEIVAELSAKTIIWGEPKVEWLKKEKKTLYLKDQKGRF